MNLPESYDVRRENPLNYEFRVLSTGGRPQDSLALKTQEQIGQGAEIVQRLMEGSRMSDANYIQSFSPGEGSGGFFQVPEITTIVQDVMAGLNDIIVVNYVPNIESDDLLARADGSELIGSVVLIPAEGKGHFEFPDLTIGEIIQKRIQFVHEDIKTALLEAAQRNEVVSGTYICIDPRFRRSNLKIGSRLALAALNHFIDMARALGNPPPKYAMAEYLSILDDDLNIIPNIGGGSLLVGNPKDPNSSRLGRIVGFVRSQEAEGFSTQAGEKNVRIIRNVVMLDIEKALARYPDLRTGREISQATD